MIFSTPFLRTVFVITFSCLTMLISGSARAMEMTLGDIIIQGNQRIERGTIETYLGLSRDSLVNSSDVNAALKRLYETGFFSDVRMELNESSQALIVYVTENPGINQLVFEGNSVIDDETLEQEVSLRERSIYTQPAVQKDVSRLLDIYRRSGHYSAVVEPKIIGLEQNRINLVYEVSEGPRTYVKDISFIGNTQFDTATLKGVVSTSEYAFYKFLDDSDIYDKDRVEFDKDLLRRFYRNEGYADVNIRSAYSELSPDKSGFYITYAIEEGPLYRLSSVEIDAGQAEKRKEKLFPLVITKPGERYNAKHVEESIQSMTEELGNLGFAFVDVNPKLERNTEEKTIALTYVIDEGPRVYVERIDIEGNVRTLDEVIRREFRIVEGDPYNTAKLRRTEQRLTNLGFFETVEIENVPGSAKDRTVLKVKVQERSTGEINIGAGFSTADGALTDFGVRERNLLGRGQDLRFNALISAERQEFDVGFTEPYFLDRDVSAGFDLYRRTLDLGQEASFDRESLGGAIRTGYSINERLRHILAYRLEKLEITDVESDASRFVRDQEGSFLTSMFGQSFNYDDRDNRFMPNSGLFWRFNQDIAGLGGDDYFLRHEILSEYYIPLSDQVTFSLAGSAGHIIPLQDDVRINHRFFIGSRRIRGFDNAGIGPRDLTTNDALGGNTFYVGSVDLMFPLGLPNDFGIRGAIFGDVGSLWNVDDSGSEVVDEAALRASFGAGILWSSPFGPIRVDFAIPAIKEDYDETESVRLNFGTRF